MFDFATLSVFSVAVIVLLLVPGPNMVFVITHSLTDGWRGGFAAALGISFADVIMTLMVGAGLGGLIMSWAPAFELIR